jgi:hypothetical protein
MLDLARRPAESLYKMGERWYNPTLGRWTKQDPINQAFEPQAGEPLRVRRRRPHQPRGSERYTPVRSTVRCVRCCRGAAGNATDRIGSGVNDAINKVNETYYDARSFISGTYKSGALGRCAVIGAAGAAIVGFGTRSWQGAVGGAAVGCAFGALRRTP